MAVGVHANPRAEFLDTDSMVSIRIDGVQTVLQRRAPLQLLGVEVAIVVAVILGHRLLGALIRRIRGSGQLVSLAAPAEQAQRQANENRFGARSCQTALFGIAYPTMTTSIVLDMSHSAASDLRAS